MRLRVDPVRHPPVGFYSVGAAAASTFEYTAAVRDELLSDLRRA
jgi:hypothetical protein